MIEPRRLHNSVAASLLALVLSATAGLGQSTEPETVERLLERLADPEQEGWEQIEDSIRREWSKSGSPAMDLLLQRGREALEAEDIEAALDHFTALTDHAPDFAEGWNLRATAYFRADLFGLAMQDIQRTLALNPNHFAAMTGLAIILEQLGMEEEALEVGRRVLELHPHRPETREAVERLQRAVEGKAI